ncbi:MAG: isochorismatase family protein [Candidatus Kapaibacterium sp.]
MLDRNHTVLVVIDAQERMLPAIDQADHVLDNLGRLIDGCHELGIPMLVTEHYSKGLGPTVATVREKMKEWYRPIEKITFSACDNVFFMQQLETVAHQHVILCGVETHVCIYQTAIDLRNLGYNVEVAADAVGSRAPGNHQLAIAKMLRIGVELTSTEMALFEMMGSADIPEFKAVAKIVK